MDKSATTLAEAQEREYTQAIGIAVAGVAIALVGLFLIYFLRLFPLGNWLGFVRVTLGLATLAGITMIAVSVQRVVRVRQMPVVMFKCPYCDAPNRLLTNPTHDFDCENCHRTIKFENGVMVPVITISCPNCGAEGKVAETTDRYLCENCNNTVRLKSEQVYGMSAGTRQAPVQRTVSLAGNYDVLLVGMDSVREGQLAAQLQTLLELTDAQEARRLLATITERTPLIIGLDMPEDEAEAIRNQLGHLGATVSLRPSGH